MSGGFLNVVRLRQSARAVLFCLRQFQNLPDGTKRHPLKLDYGLKGLT